MKERINGLIKFLINSSVPLRIRDIAESLQVSERTIKYDLNDVRVWLKHNGADLLSKPNCGIWIEYGHADIETLQAGLRQMDAEAIPDFSARFRYVFFELLLSKNALPIPYFAKKYKVTRNTISADLSFVELKLKKWDLKISRGRYGILLEGDKEGRRLALEYVLNESLTSEDALKLLSSVMHGLRGTEPLSDLLETFFCMIKNQDYIFRTAACLGRSIERLNQAALIDRTILSLVLRLAIEQCCPIEENEAESPPSSALNKLIGSALAQSGYGVFPIDVQFIADIFLRGAIPLPQSGDLNVSLITHNLIQRVSSSLDVDFSDDVSFFNQLYDHISKRIMLLYIGEQSTNPLVKEVASAYRSLFRRVKSACIQIFYRHGIVLNDTDIALIVVHFQIAFERRNQRAYWRVMIVCSAEYGIAQLLGSIIEKEVRSIRSIQYCSILDAEQRLAAADVDLIISVFPIKAKVPVVVISPFINKQDIQNIKIQLNLMPNKLSVRPDIYQVERRKNTDSIIGVGTECSAAVIYKYYQFGQDIVQQFSAYLSAELAEEIMLHCLLMVVRIETGQPDLRFEHPDMIGEQEQLWLEQLAILMKKRKIIASEGELFALLNFIRPEPVLV